MTTITEQLEGLLPADGVYTKDQRIIAEAVGELRTKALLLDLLRHDTQAAINRMGDRKPGKLIWLGAAYGIALAVLVGWVW
jgi:hypothetical protein